MAKENEKRKWRKKKKKHEKKSHQINIEESMAKKIGVTRKAAAKKKISNDIEEEEGMAAKASIKASAASMKAYALTYTFCSYYYSVRIHSVLFHKKNNSESVSGEKAPIMWRKQRRNMKAKSNNENWRASASAAKYQSVKIKMAYVASHHEEHVEQCYQYSVKHKRQSVWRRRGKQQ